MKKAFFTAPIIPVGFIFVCLAMLLLFNACKQEPRDMRIKQWDHETVSNWAKASEESANPEIAEGFSLKIWASDSLVADPISIDIDDAGKVYYSRTNRRRVSEIDIRSHQDWEIASIKMQSVEDRRNFLHTALSPENSDKNQWLPDLNNDGSHDWRDLAVEKENVYRLEDSDGDGLADKFQLVVEDFNEEITDVAGAVMTVGEDLFVGVAPDLWRMQDTNGDGIMDKKTSISHGYGVHIGFGGHNMSGLTMGPAGRIYWAIGDLGFNGKGPDGKEWKYPNQGVIVRCNPDGSDFEVFAAGLRNTHEFVFDEFANLISVDNDGDHAGESERLVYLVNGSDTGWRINWQFGKYRDPENNPYKVWMDEGLFKPRFEGQAAYITPPIANYINGPTGMLYNPGTALSPAYKNTFFVVEFVGNPTRSGIHAFKLKPKGASFELAETSKILGGVLATGLDFSPDGAIYVADWIEGWVNKGYGRIWKMDVDGGQDWPERQETARILGEDAQKMNLDYLNGLLKNPDLRVRKKAQFELVRRGSEGAEVLERNIMQSANQLARIHGIIGLSQLGRLQNMAYAEPLVSLLEDSDPEIRAQAAKWLGDIRYAGAGEALVGLLDDDHSRPRFFAAEALGRIGFEPAVSPLINLLESNDDEDAYIRHAGSLALARIGRAEPLLALADHPSKAVRIAAVVALRRMAHPGVATFLEDGDEHIVTEAARAINDDFSIMEALPQLGNLLLTTPFSNEALIRRAINANLRVGSEEALRNLISYSERMEAPAALRVEALQALGTWPKPSVLDRVDGRYRGEVERDPTAVRNLSAKPLIALLQDSVSEVRLNAANTLGKLEIQEGAGPLFEVMTGDSDVGVRVVSLRALAQLGGEQINGVIKRALSDPNRELRVAGLDLLQELDIPPSLLVELLTDVIEKQTIPEKQAAVMALSSIPLQEAQPLLDELLTRLEEGDLPPEIHFELAEVIEASDAERLSKRLELYHSQLSSDSVTASYEGSLYGGDPELGNRIFFKNQSAQCIRCHAYDDMGGSAGPPLNGIADKLSRKQLLEALIEPSKRLAPGYGMVMLELDNGNTLSGVLLEETPETLVLKPGNNPDTVVQKAAVIKRTDAPSSMPDMKNLLSRREIRDLVSFLATLRNDD